MGFQTHRLPLCLACSRILGRSMNPLPFVSLGAELLRGHHFSLLLACAFVLQVDFQGRKQTASGILEGRCYRWEGSQKTQTWPQQPPPIGQWEQVGQGSGVVQGLTFIPAWQMAVWPRNCQVYNWTKGIVFLTLKGRLNFRRRNLLLRVFCSLVWC